MYNTTPIRIAETIRSEHKRDFLVIDNAVIRDTRLTDRARSIVFHLLSRPNQWRIVPKYLAKQMNLSANTVSKYLTELEQYGYIIRERLRDDAGRFIGSIHRIMESSIYPNLQAPSAAFSPTTQKTTARKTTPRKLGNILNTKINNERIKEITILPSNSPSLNYQSDEEERDYWFDSDLEPDNQEYGIVVPVNPVAIPVEVDLSAANPQPEIANTAPISSESRSSAADYNQVTEVVVKPTRTERKAAQLSATWVEFGKENGLWTTLEELQGFMTSLYTFAINNPRLHTPSKWVESEVQKTCERGTGTHWIEYQAGLNVGTIDRKPWADVYGNTNLSFRSYIEQSKYGEAGNSTARAVELAAIVLANPFKAGLMWNEYQRRLERELEEKVKCERLGVSYDAPGVLKPKLEVSAEQTAQVQRLLGIDAASQVYLPAIAEIVAAPVLAETQISLDSAQTPAVNCQLLALIVAEVSTVNCSEAPWDEIAAKMTELEQKMGVSKTEPQVTPLSEIYGEPKLVNQQEAEEFKVWYDWAKSEQLVDYSYSDPKHHAIVVLADGKTALPWREAKRILIINY
ncbi:MAG: helix-turn-helix domain-containing protein [Chamaesiphon sp.]|nr:helix-turn-helix domain-containing protein [Chamaesiphon sp.]